MEFVDIIAREAISLPIEKQKEVIYFIKFLKEQQLHSFASSEVRTTEEIIAFFRSFNADTTGYNFDREEANSH